MITITVDTSQLDRKLADIPDALMRARKRALEDIGEAVVSRTTRAFRSASLRPSPWPERKKVEIKKDNQKKKRKKGKKKGKKKKNWPLLIKSGLLRQSFDYKLDGSIVVVGSDKEYAIFHQFGTKYIPARPFFPIDKYGELLPDFREKLNRIVRKAYKAELDEALGK